MSPLLAVAIVLLVLVVGVTIVQRRGQTPPYQPRRDRSPSPTPPELPDRVAPETTSSETRIKTDPLLGMIAYDDGRWRSSRNWSGGAKT